MSDFKTDTDFTLTSDEIREFTYKEKDATKLRTANTLEQIMEKSAMPYSEVFGLRREMKAFLRYASGQGQKIGGYWANGYLLEMTQCREDFTHQFPDKS
jgi:hypothetical protein